jgi:hypothetical protein
MTDQQPLVIVVGGFLGAGKTTLIMCAADMLRRYGHRVAVITNDQGQHLVDTQRLRAEGFDAAEIGGGCFCCRFSALIEAAESVRRFDPGIIFAEPVGSCTDLAATVLQPLQAFYKDRFRVAPFTVVIDPDLARRTLAAGADPDIRFLFESQVREADLLCYSKADLYFHFPEVGNDEPLRVSAVTGEGVREWLHVVLGWKGARGAQTLTIDYDRYAAAEASLGWLNARLELELHVPASPAHVIGPMLEQLNEQLSLAGATIAHLKVFDRTQSSYLKAGILQNGQEPLVEGDLLAPAERRHEVFINLRARAKPEQLRRAVDDVIGSLPGQSKTEIQAFTPGYPTPEKRISARV